MTGEFIGNPFCPCRVRLVPAGAQVSVGDRFKCTACNRVKVITPRHLEPPKQTQRCTLCGKPGHYSQDCPKRGTGKRPCDVCADLPDRRPPGGCPAPPVGCGMPFQARAAAKSDPWARTGEMI